MIWLSSTRKKKNIKTSKKSAIPASISRQVLLSEISEGSRWAKTSDPKDDEKITDNLQHLKETLKLDGVEIELLEQEQPDSKFESGYLTARQSACLNSLNFEIMRKNICGAYHELYDFIDSYGALNLKPIDLMERTIINASVNQIERLIREKTEA